MVYKGKVMGMGPPEPFGAELMLLWLWIQTQSRSVYCWPCWAVFLFWFQPFFYAPFLPLENERVLSDTVYLRQVAFFNFTGVHS